MVVLTLQISCGKKDIVSSSDSGSTLPPNDAGDTQPPSNYLWLHHKAETGALRYSHVKGDWSQSCKVDLDSTDPAKRDIECMTESTELDLMSIGLDLEYNVPAHAKCPYAITMAPYFFQYEPPRDDSGDIPAPAKPHTEPSYVYVFVNTKFSYMSSAVGYYNTYHEAYPNPTVTPIPVPPTPATSDDVANGIKINPYFHSTGGSYSCGFDYTPYGPNCCEGDYIERRVTLSDPTTGAFTDEQTTKSWGGDRSNCLSGPGIVTNPPRVGKWPSIVVWRMQKQIEQGAKSVTDKALQKLRQKLGSVEVREASPKTKTQFMPKADSSPTSLNFGSFNIPSLINSGYGTTRYISSFSPIGEPKAFTDVLNYFFRNDSSGKNPRKSYAHPSYFTVVCADYALEVTARIRLQVREWNTFAALQKAAEPTTAREDNVAGNETDYPEFPNADFLDWEDITGWMDAYDNNGSRSGTQDFGTYPGPSL